MRLFLVLRMRIPLTEYLRFLESCPDSRNVIEGQNIEQAGHIIMYGILSEVGLIKELFALCLQRSGLSSHPHEVQINVDLPKMTITGAICTCKGGAIGKCKHVSAVLWICMSNDIENFCVLTSTDLACWWKEKQKRVVDSYRLNKICEHECWQKEESQTEVVLSDSTKKEIDNAFASIETSAFSIYRNEGDSDLTIVMAPVPTPVIAGDILESLANAVLKSDLTILEKTDLPNCCEATYQFLFGKTNWFYLPSETQDRSKW